MDYPNRLADARALAGLTQQQMADALGITLNGYQNYEYGKRDLKSSTVIAASKALNCTASFILGLDPDPAPQAPAPHNVAAQAESDLLVAFRDLNEEGQRAALAAVRGLAAVYKEQRGEHGRVEEVASQAYAARPFADSWDI